ncbi:hypothetical protein [Streptomyces sp. AGS-58]|uniref:hypothetical protein n=1 Tax=unclassified Streptomyces TaxID=2593676 RepID=UPI0035A2F3A1
MVAAVLTVLFTGVSTFFQACVASDQLHQSKEDARREERAQASRITFWVDQGSDHMERVHLKNGSVDPVSNLVLVVYVYTAAYIRATPDGEYDAFLPGLAPCSELVIDNDSFALPGGKPVLLLTHPVVKGVEFVDSSGKTWLRTGEALTSSYSPIDKWLSEIFSHYGPLRLRRQPAVKPVSPCS